MSLASGVSSEIEKSLLAPALVSAGVAETFVSSNAAFAAGAPIRPMTQAQRTAIPAPRTRVIPARMSLPVIIARSMPIYEYRCDNGHEFEVFQAMADDPVTVCEVCGKPVERVFSPVAVHYKGSGFYTTDYAKKGSSKSASSSDGGSSSSDSKSDSARSPTASPLELRQSVSSGSSD